MQTGEQIKNPVQRLLGLFLVPHGERTEAQVFEHGEHPEHPAAFGRLGQPAPHHFMARQGVQILSLKTNRAAGSPHKPADGQQGRGFSGAIRTKDTHDFAFVNAQAHAVQHFFRAVPGLQIFDVQKHPNSRIVRLQTGKTYPPHLHYEKFRREGMGFGEGEGSPF